MKFLTFVKEYVQEHPHLTFKEAVKSEEVKCLYHKSGKATHCKDDESKGVVVNVNNNCNGEEKKEKKEKKLTPKAIERAYTTPQPALPPRVTVPPAATAEHASAPLNVRKIKEEIREELLKDIEDQIEKMEKEIQQEETRQREPEMDKSQVEAKEKEKEVPFKTEESTIDDEINSLYDVYGEDADVIVDSEFPDPISGEGVKKKKKKVTPKSIQKSYTAPRSTPGPREYLPPKPDFRRGTNDREKEALLKIIDAMRLILN